MDNITVLNKVDNKYYKDLYIGCEGSELIARFTFRFKHIKDSYNFLNSIRATRKFIKKGFESVIESVTWGNTIGKLWILDDNMEEDNIIVMAVLTFEIPVSDIYNIEKFLNIVSIEMLDTIRLNELKYFINNERVKELVTSKIKQLITK